jgi:hypothetical protein
LPAGVSGQGGASPEDVYYGAKLLAALGQKPAGVCATAQALLSGRGGDAVAVGFGLGALKEGGCAAELAAAGGQESVLSALKAAWQAEGFQGKRLALLGDLALGGNKAVTVDAAVKQLNKHRNEEGLVAESPEAGSSGSGKGGAASTEGTFALLETIAQAKVASKGIRKTLEKAVLLLPGGAVDSGASDASLLAALDQALKALGADNAPAASVAALGLGDEQVAALARKLLRMKNVASPKAAYKAYAGLLLLAKALPNAPLAVVVATPVVAPGEPFKVEVRTLLGQAPPSLGGVSVESLQVPGKGHDLDAFRDQPLKAKGGAFEGATAGLAPGLYELVLAVGGQGGVKRSLIVKGSGAVEQVEVTVGGKTHKQALPSGAKAAALEGDVVGVRFTLASPAPAQQAFLRFTLLGASGPAAVETLYAARRQERAGGEGYDYSASVALVDEMAAFAHASGDYALSLLVADVSLATPLEVALGTLHLAFPTKAKEHYPLYTRPLLWDSDNALAPLPEIHHQFRQPEKRPNPVVPAAFTLLVLAGLAFFALYLPRIGANLEGLPTGADSAWATAWLACLAAIVLLLAAYWLKLKAVATLKYLLALALVTVFVGHQALGRKSPASSASSSSSA